MNMMETPYYIQKIKLYLEEKQKINSAYSLRALARDFNLDSSSLSQVLRGRRILPLNVANTIADRMKLSDKERTLFFESLNRLRFSIDDIEIKKLDDRFMLDGSYYKVIAEWEHYAVLSLLELDGFTADESSIAERLNIKTDRAKQVLDNLESSLLIRRAGNRIIKVHDDVRTTEDVPSQALDDSHLETLELGKEKLKIRKALRDFSSSTFSIDMAKLPQAKTIIREFRQKMTALLKDGNKTEVYQLAIQFYPLTNTDDSKV